MKKILFIALLLIPFFGISQTTKPIEGFLGVKFGTARPGVIAALKAKGGILNVKGTTPDVLYFKNLKLGKRNVTACLVKFVNNKAYEADLIFDAGQAVRTIEYYYELVNDINAVYGAGDSKKTFKDPYNDDDSDNVKITAIRTANAEYATYWLSENKNAMSVNIDEELAVVLTYQDDALTDAALAKDKAKEKSDF